MRCLSKLSSVLLWKEWGFFSQCSSSLSMSVIADGSGKISLDNLLCDDEKSFPPLLWEPTLPDCLNPLLLICTGTALLSDELCLRLPKKATFQDFLEEAVLSLTELELSSLTTFRGFSNALSTYLMSGRFEGLGLRHDRATIAMAHTSSSKSSSTIRDGSMIFVTNSLSCTLMQDRVCSNHSLVVASSDLLMPSLPVTSSSKTFPKQNTSWAQLADEDPAH